MVPSRYARAAFPRSGASEGPLPEHNQSFWDRLIYSYLPVLGLISYFIILMLPWWWLSDWYDLVAARETSAALPYQAVGFAIFSLTVLPLALRTLGQNEFITLRTPRGVFVAGFFACCIAFLVLTDAPGLRPVIYAILTWALFISGAAFWAADYGVVKWGLGWAGLVILVFLVLLLLKHGITNPGTARRAVGGIQPNSYGRAALVGLVLVLFLPRWLTYPSAAVALTLIILVSSRSALLAAAIFVLCYGSLTTWSIRFFPSLLRVATVMLAVAGAVMTLELYLLSAYGAGLPALLSEKVLLVDDPTRGLGSGFTGRTQLWLSGLQAVAEHPWFGNGFRRTGESAHSGYINLMLDVGIPMAGWFIAFVIVEVGRRIAAIRRLRVQRLSPPENQERLLQHRVISSYLVAMLATWILEPNYLNIGTANIVLFLMFLAAPIGCFCMGKPTSLPSHRRTFA